MYQKNRIIDLEKIYKNPGREQGRIISQQIFSAWKIPLCDNHVKRINLKIACRRYETQPAEQRLEIIHQTELDPALATPWATNFDR